MSANTKSARLAKRIREAGKQGHGDKQLKPTAAAVLDTGLPGSASCVSPSKELGAYYTDPKIADFLVRWAVATGQDIVLDPSSGDGVFLSAAVERIRELGGNGSQQVYGVEIDELAHRRSAFRGGPGAPPNLLHANFFDLREGDLPGADAVVGNPPFIRYQRFSGEARARALERAREVGVQIPQLASAWAPFLVHAVRFVNPCGRLAMVAPAELTHAAYARPVLQFLARSFRAVSILTFQRRLFKDLSEDTVLVLAGGRGLPLESFRLVDLPDVSALRDSSEPGSGVLKGVAVDPTPVVEGKERLLNYLLPKHTRDLYRELRQSPSVAALGNLASVGIGYVTGDNDFFHLDRLTAEAYSIPPDCLRRAVRDSSELTGLRFVVDDWEALHNRGRANLLLYLHEDRELTASLRAYLKQGIRKGVPLRYKCRVRDPWYCVPHVYDADGFLTYMSGMTPRLVANEAGAVAPNALHVVRLNPGSGFEAFTLAASWHTSLTALSCELEGHSLGGGMLKLEPTEARAVMVAIPSFRVDTLRQLAAEMDELLRAGRHEFARNLADTTILRSGLGLSQAEIGQLRDAFVMLQARRIHR